MFTKNKKKFKAVFLLLNKKEPQIINAVIHLIY